VEQRVSLLTLSRQSGLRSNKEILNLERMPHRGLFVVVSQGTCDMQRVEIWRTI
jgi:hypothetical protein